MNKREEQSPTVFENGIAIPHVQSDAVKEATIFIIRTNEPIKDYESIMPTNEVRLVFLIAVTKNAGSEHLKLLSELSSKLMDVKLVNNIINANEVEIIKLLSFKK